MARDISPSARKGSVTERSSSGDVEAFLREARELGPVSSAARGRLIFALDATMSRQPTWDLACQLQSSMFDAAASVGGLSVQLVYFRGMGESRASRWIADARALGDIMVRMSCRGGLTQIGKVLSHARREAEKRPVAALIYVGDAMEENVDRLAQQAGELGLLNVRAFMFHEGRDPAAEQAFREVARLTKGAYLPFNSASADELRALLGAIAAYAAGGLSALEARKDRASQRLLPHLSR